MRQAAHDTDAPVLAPWGQDPSSPPGAEQKDIISALTRVLTSAGLDSEGRALAHALRGREHYNAKEMEASLADFTVALDLAPRLARTLAGRGRTYFPAQRYNEALTDLERLIELEPHNAWAHALRGRTYQARGQYDDALTDYTRVLELDPGNVWARTQRGDTYQAIGRYDAVLTDLDRVLELEPDNAWAFAVRGKTYRLMGRYDDALADLTAGSALDPADAWIPYELAAVLYLLGMPGWEAQSLRAEQLHRDAGADGSLSATDTSGNLFFLQCVRQDWTRAARTLEEFLGSGPSDERRREAADDLEEAVEIFCLPTEPVQSLRRMLRRTLPR